MTQATTQTVPEVKEQACPQCGAMIPVYAAYTPWCDRCNWNIHPYAPPPTDNLFEKLHRSISRQSRKQLFEQMVKAQSLKARLTPEKIAAFFMAGCVHSLTLVFIGLGVWLLIIGVSNLVALPFALPFFFLAWIFLPGVLKLEDQPLPKDQFPMLYQLAERINQALNNWMNRGSIRPTRRQATGSNF